MKNSNGSPQNDQNQEKKQLRRKSYQVSNESRHAKKWAKI